MKNIWIVLGPYLAIMLGFLIAAAIVLIKKPKSYVTISITLTLLVVAALITWAPPYFRDLTKQELITFQGVCTEYIAGTTLGAIYINKFKSGNEVISVEIPKLVYMSYNPEIGKKYKVTYFKNSKIIYSLELIE